MKRTIVFLVFLMGMVQMYAQIDTIRYDNPWYMLHERPDTIKTDGPWGFRQFTTTNCGPAVMSYKTDTCVMLYGVAITMDTTIEEYPQTWETDTNFYAVVYKNDKSNPSKYLLVDTARCDFITGNIARPLRTPVFEFECDQPDTDYYCHSYEIYFKRPIPFEAGDSIFVGRHLYFAGKVRPNIVYLTYADSARTTTTIMGYSESGPYTLTSTPVSLPARWIYPYWGLFFPIVNLRCTEPREWRLDSAWADSAVFVWQRHDEAYGWELRAVDTHNGIVDSLTYPVNDPEQTRFALPLAPGHSYAVQLRKLSRYTTTGYDTIVHSGWTGHIGVEGPEATEGIAAEASMMQTITVSPNPANAEVRVVSNCPLARLEAFDISGRRMALLEATGTAATLDVRNWPAGSYLLRVSTHNGSYIKKLVVE